MAATPGDLPLVVKLNNPDMSYKIYTWMEATSWRFLPYAGGLIDQPDWLMDDLFTLRVEADEIKKVNKGSVGNE